MKPYYEEPSVVIYNGDCRDVLPLLDRVDTVITDPPYESEAHTLGRRVRRAGQVCEEPLPFDPIDWDVRREISMQLGRLVRRWALVFCHVEASTDWRLELERAGLIYKRSCVWVKPDGQPQLTGDRPGMGYETIVVTHRPGRSRWNGGGKTGVFVHNKNEGGKAPHPTTKPLRLMTELVGLFTDPGELILDPFAGSGTTGVAAKALGRCSILIEREEQYCEIIARRLAQESLFSAMERQRIEQVALPLGGEE